MRPLDSPRPADASVNAVVTTGNDRPTAEAKSKRAVTVPTVERRATATGDEVVSGGKARFVAEPRSVLPGATTRHPATLAVAKTPVTCSVDAVSLCEMAHTNVSGGSFTAEVPMRAGEVALDIGKSEPIKLRIPPGTVAVITAKLKPSKDGLFVTDVNIDFGKNRLDLLNPGAFIGSALGGGLLGGLLGGVMNKALDVKVQRLGIDDTGLLQPYGIAKKAGIDGLLEDAIPKSMLPRLDLHLNKFVAAGATPSLPDLPSMDPRQLLAALGGKVEQATFKLQLDGASQTISVANDGAEIQSPAGRGTLKLTGELTRDASGALAGTVGGSLEASLAATIALASGDNAIAANGLKIAYKDNRLVLDAGDLQVCRAIAGQLSVFVGDTLSIDAKTSATIGSQLKVAFAKDGSLTISANNVEATLGLNAAKASSPRFTLALGDPSSATFKLAELGLGATGLVARGADGAIDLKIEGGQLDLGGAKFGVKPGRIGLKAKAESAETGGSAAVAVDLPLEAQVGPAKATANLKGTFDISLAL
jgi:hypothetical protein